jgi:hypothetical protein
MLVPQSPAVGGMFIGAAASIIGSAVSSPIGGGRRRTDGWVERHPFLTSLIMNAMYGALLGQLTADAAAL